MAGRGDGTRATLLLAVCESLARCQDTAGLSSAPPVEVVLKPPDLYS